MHYIVLYSCKSHFLCITLCFTIYTVHYSCKSHFLCITLCFTVVKCCKALLSVVKRALQNLFFSGPGLSPSKVFLSKDKKSWPKVESTRAHDVKAVTHDVQTCRICDWSVQGEGSVCDLLSKQ